MHRISIQKLLFYKIVINLKGGVPTLTVINIGITQPSGKSNMAVTSKVIDAILTDTVITQGRRSTVVNIGFTILSSVASET